MKTKTEQYQRAHQLYKMEYIHFTDKYIPLNREFKPILKKGTLEEKITTLWLWLENDRFFVEDTEEWITIAKTIEKDCDAPVLEWCALYYITLDWLYNIRNFIKVAKESIVKISAREAELEHLKTYKDLTYKLVELAKAAIPFCKNQKNISKILGNDINRDNLFFAKQDEKIGEMENLLKEIEEDTTNLIGGIKSSGVAFTEYYERLGFANFMPTALTDMIKELSSSYYDLPKYKFFYEKIKPYKPLTNKTIKKIQKNIKIFLDE